MTTSCIGSTTNAYQPPATDSFNQLFKDFTGIGGAIQSGDLTTAQTALTSFQGNLQSNTGNNPLSKLFGGNPTLSNDLTAVQTALKSNDAAGAQTAFTTLLQDMKGAMQSVKGKHHHHHHHGVNNSGANQGSGSTTDPSGSTTDSTSTSSSVGSLLNVQA